MENIFSQEFNQFSSELLITALKGLEEEKSRNNLLESAKNGSNGAQPVSGLTAFITSIGKIIFGFIISPLWQLPKILLFSSVFLPSVGK